MVNIEQSGLVKPERDDTEFQHLYFLQGHEHLLEHIKRKVRRLIFKWFSLLFYLLSSSESEALTHTEEKAEGLFTQYCMIVYVFVYSQVSIVKSEETKVRQEDLSKLLYEVQVLRSQQENMEMQMQDMKQ